MLGSGSARQARGKHDGSLEADAKLPTVTPHRLVVVHVSSHQSAQLTFSDLRTTDSERTFARMKVPLGFLQRAVERNAVVVIYRNRGPRHGIR